LQSCDRQNAERRLAFVNPRALLSGKQARMAR
jgi:hypothetical protein